MQGHNTIFIHTVGFFEGWICGFPVYTLHSPCTLFIPRVHSHSPCTLYIPRVHSHSPCTLFIPRVHSPFPVYTPHSPCTLSFPVYTLHSPCTLCRGRTHLQTSTRSVNNLCTFLQCTEFAPRGISVSRISSILLCNKLIL